jgi:hypothetical protein
MHGCGALAIACAKVGSSSLEVGVSPRCLVASKPREDLSDMAAYKRDGLLWRPLTRPR